MTPERYQALKKVFNAARELGGSSRGAFLDSACGGDAAMRGEVDRLLGAHDGEHRLLNSSGDDGLALAAKLPGASTATERANIPTRIGNYTIQGVLGEGGMGIVYEAQQERPRRSVALKMVRSPIASKRILRRFEHEAELLGRLQHSAIAEIFEAGVHEMDVGGSVISQPFFAMELVRGEPITEYCDLRRLAVRDRLRLFERVCQAVAHAHLKGVIHRDLKPANILVSEGSSSVSPDSGSSITPTHRGLAPQPKILDFGVARATDSDLQTTTLQTEVGQLIGTVSYMSPEQARGRPDEIDLRSDVYSLGVVLYELLTGRLPYDLEGLGLPESLRVICERSPRAPSSLSRALRGDLERIVLKAIAKEPELRYGSAAALAEDIERYLSNQPISARTPSAAYQLRKLVARRPLSSSLATALFVLAIGSAGLLTHHYRQAVTARDMALKVQAFFGQILSAAHPTKGREVTLRETLDEAAIRIESELGDHLQAKSRVHMVIGRAYQELRDSVTAEEHLREALRLGLVYNDEERLEIAEIKLFLGRALRHQSRYGEAWELINQALGTRQRLLGNVHPLVADSLDALAAVRKRERNFAEAERLCRRALLIHPDYPLRQVNLAHLLIRKGELTEAERLLTSAEPAMRRDSHPGQVAWLLSGLAALAEKRGDGVTAESHLSEALELVRSRRGNDHPAVAVYLDKLGDFMRRTGRFDRAEPLLLEGLAIRRVQWGDRHREVAESLMRLGHLAAERGDWATARKRYEEALTIRLDVLPKGHPDIAISTYELGVAFCRLERFIAAERELQQAVEMLATAPGVEIIQCDAERWLGACLLRQRRFEEAESCLLAAYDRSHSAELEGTRTQAPVERMIELYQAWGKDTETAEWRAKLADS